MSVDVVAEIVGNPAADAATETPAVETPVEGTIPDPAAEQAPEQDDNMSARFAALSRKEKYLQEQANSMKDKEAQFNSVTDLQAKVKENPLAVLEHFGISLDDLITSSLGEDAPPATVESQIEKLRAEIEGYKTSQQEEKDNAIKAQEEADQNSITEAIAAHQFKITDHLSQNVEKYELISLQGAQDLVWEVTEAHFDANEGQVLTPEEAADKVEAYLEEQVRKAMDLSRFKTETQEKESVPFEVEATTVPQPTTKPQSQTLTQNTASTSAPAQTEQHVNREESKRKAANLLKWN